MDGIAGVEARIQEIESRFGSFRAGGILGTQPGGDGSDATHQATGAFADALSSAQSGAPAGSGKPNRAAVDPVQWARAFLTKLGMPVTAENVRAIAAWEQAEGTAAQFTPLATTQAGFPGETRFNSVGVKNYVTFADGINANAHALTNGLYGNILAALHAGNSAQAVAQAIADSPWGTHGGVLRVLASQQ